MAIAAKDTQGRWYCTECGTMTNAEGVLFTSAQAVKGHSRSCAGKTKASRQLKIAKARQSRGETMVDGVPDPEIIDVTPAFQKTLSGLGSAEPIFGMSGNSITQDQYSQLRRQQDLIIAKLGNIETARHVQVHNDSEHILGFEKKKFWMVVGAVGVIGLIIYMSRSQQNNLAGTGIEDCDERYDDAFLKTNDDEKALTAKRNCQLHNSRMARRSGGGGSLGGLGILNPLLSAVGGSLGRAAVKTFF